MTILSNVKKQQIEVKKMKKQGNMFQTKELGKTPETNRNEMEISDLPDNEFKIIVNNHKDAYWD